MELKGRKQIKHREEMTSARQRLTDEYGLGDDPDVLFGLADELYNGMRFAECYRVTTKYTFIFFTSLCMPSR